MPSRDNGEIFGKWRQKDGRCYAKGSCDRFYGIETWVVVPCEHFGDARWRPFASPSQLRLGPVPCGQFASHVGDEGFGGSHVFHAS